MDEFTMSAFALYSHGRTGDAFAEVSEVSLVACFDKMAGEVADWLPGALARGAGAEAPRAIDLTLEWSGAPAAPEPAPEPPAAPSDSAREVPRPPRRSVRCAARRRFNCSGRIGFAAPAGSCGAPA